MLIAFVGGRVVVGNGQVWERASVLVEGDRILKVAQENFTPPKGCRRIPWKASHFSPALSTPTSTCVSTPARTP